MHHKEPSFGDMCVARFSAAMAARPICLDKQLLPVLDVALPAGHLCMLSKIEDSAVLPLCQAILVAGAQITCLPVTRHVYFS